MLYNILDKMGFPLHLATLELSLFICNKVQPFLTFCQGEWPLAVFFFEKLKELLTSIMERFICPAVFAVISSTWKMLKINLKKEEKLISSDNVRLVGTARAINKCTATQALEVKKSKQNAQKFLIHLVEKKTIPFTSQIHTYFMSFTKPGSFFQRQIFD